MPDGHGKDGRVLEVCILVNSLVEARVLVGVGQVDRFPGCRNVAGDAGVEGEPALKCILLGLAVGLVDKVGLGEVVDLAEGRLGPLVHQQHHRPLTLDEAEHVGEDPVDGGLEGGLLLEDDPGQVQQNLVPLYLQLKRENSNVM